MEWPMGCPSVRSSAQESAESTSERLTRAAIVTASLGGDQPGVYRYLLVFTDAYNCLQTARHYVPAYHSYPWSLQYPPFR
jgi:hypothetical protein